MDIDWPTDIQTHMHTLIVFCCLNSNVYKAYTLLYFDCISKMTSQSNLFWVLDLWAYKTLELATNAQVCTFTLCFCQSQYCSVHLNRYTYFSDRYIYIYIYIYLVWVSCMCLYCMAVTPTTKVLLCHKHQEWKELLQLLKGVPSR